LDAQDGQRIWFATVLKCPRWLPIVSQVTRQIVSERAPSPRLSANSPTSDLPHDQSLDVVLLRDGNKFLNGATDEVFAQLDRQARVEILRNH
jgi:hypothetical protein